MRDMIYNVADLNDRTLVESNVLKSFILAQDGAVMPKMDDVLIHDYQMANSVTINTILSNFLVDLKYAWNLYDDSLGQYKQSYFQVVEGLSEEEVSRLPAETKLILDANEGSFMQRDLRYNIDRMFVPDGTREFVNLDTVWYGIVRDKGQDSLLVVEDMNNFANNPNPFGVDVETFYTFN